MRILFGVVAISLAVVLLFCLASDPATGVLVKDDGAGRIGDVHNGQIQADFPPNSDPAPQRLEPLDRYKKSDYPSVADSNELVGSSGFATDAITSETSVSTEIRHLGEELNPNDNIPVDTEVLHIGPAMDPET